MSSPRAIKIESNWQNAKGAKMSSSQKKSQAKLEHMTKAQLQKELTDAYDLVEEREKELNLLQKKLKEAKSKTAKLKGQRQKLENRLAELDKRNADLNEKISDLQPTEETISEDFSVGRAAFRIELYPRQGHYHGKIEHPLTKDKKVFSGLDNESIIAFISKHLPQKEQEPIEAQPAILPKAAVAEAITADQKEHKQIRNLNIIPSGAWRSTGVIPHDSPFHVQLTVDPSELMKQKDTALNYKLSVYAKRLGGGFRQTIGEVEGEIKTSALFKTKIASAPLPSGTYRFEAVGTMNEKEKQSSIDIFRKSSLINVL